MGSEDAKANDGPIAQLKPIVMGSVIGNAQAGTAHTLSNRQEPVHAESHSGVAIYSLDAETGILVMISEDRVLTPESDREYKDIDGLISVFHDCSIRFLPD